MVKGSSHQAAERDYSAAITGLLASLAPDKAAWERARAASVAARVAKHEDPQAGEKGEAFEAPHRTCTAGRG